MERRRRRPWRILAPLVAVVVLAVLWSVYWAVAAAAIKDAYAQAEQSFAARGLSLACGAGEWSGYPFRVERNCAGPRLSIAAPQGHFDISAPSLLLAVQAYDPRHAIALLDGPITILRGADSQQISHGRALASLRLSGDDNWQASLELPKLAVPRIGQADRLLLHARTADKGAALALTAEKLILALANSESLSIDTLDLTVAVPEEALRLDIRRYLATTGKEITVTNVKAKRGELIITGSGTVGIDGEGYPTGRIPTRINRVDLLFEIVKDVADLSDDDLAAAKTLVDLLQKNGGSLEPQIDLIAKDRKLYWGPFKLADLAPLV